MHRRLLTIALAWLAASCSSMSMAQQPPSPAPAVGDYKFDSHPRSISESGRECPDVDLVEHTGEFIAYNRGITVDAAFRPKLVAFERVVAEEARAVFGEEPRELIHRGGYRCRPVTGSRSKWSEHAFGNAIDIAGFAFGTGDDAFVVDVGDDWRETSGEAGRRAEFLHRIVRRAIDERLFRIILGPGDPGHEELLHLDYGTSWYVRVELPENVETASTSNESPDSGTRTDEGDPDEASPRPKVRVLKR
jgi:hypothetical protein